MRGMDTQPTPSLSQVQDHLDAAIRDISSRQAALAGKVAPGLLQRLMHATLSLSEATRALKEFRSGNGVDALYAGVTPELLA